MYRTGSKLNINYTLSSSLLSYDVTWNSLSDNSGQYVEKDLNSLIEWLEGTEVRVVTIVWYSMAENVISSEPS